MGYVYFVQELSSKNIKIGFTEDVQKRISKLQTGSPTKLKLLGYINGNRLKESELHKKFAKLRTTGEWFRFSEEIIEFINDNNLMMVYIDSSEDGTTQVLKKMKR